MNEQEFLFFLKKNDPSAIRAVFDRFHAPLCLLAYRMVKDKDQAKDIVQEVLIKLWRNRQALELTVSLQAYLRKATVNTALNYLEHANRWKKHELDEPVVQRLVSGTLAQELPYKELEEKAREAVNDLPVRTRMVFTLIRSEEMSYKEVAEALNISVKAVEKEMMRALRLLREALKDHLNTAIILLLAGTL
jgi:RNA polymerase sigma-70 factor, ECF subfamily